jgi:hypothetical protein
VAVAKCLRNAGVSGDLDSADLQAVADASRYGQLPSNLGARLRSLGGSEKTLNLLSIQLRTYRRHRFVPPVRSPPASCGRPT